jgi:EF-P beta-lysylation protein EpmB
MITGTPLIRQPPAWQRELTHAVTDAAELVRLLGLDPALIEPARAAARQFGLRAPRGYVARMRPGDPADPLLRQVLPLAAENVAAPDFVLDPVGDLSSMAVPGVLHKYQGRVLLTITGACAVHCRYCFRRHFPYGDANPASEQWGAALKYIADDASIREVILSGGDPLTLTDDKLAGLLRRLNDIAHLERLRIHTRLPIVLPARVTRELCGTIGASRLQTVVVVHANHANEIDADVAAALRDLRDAGATLLNQSVLLAGVNDDADALCALSERLFTAGVLPYYLHLLDRVQGAAHFDVDGARAERLWRVVAARLPGYLVPRLVREVAGAAYKLPLAVGSSPPSDPTIIPPSAMFE